MTEKKRTLDDLLHAHRNRSWRYEECGDSEAELIACENDILAWHRERMEELREEVKDIIANQPFVGEWDPRTFVLALLARIDALPIEEE